MAKPQKLNNRTHLRSHFIYFNLHKRCWSLKSERTTQPEGTVFTTPTVKGRVTGHADTILAVNVTTKISEAGRQRVIREKRKNVHAGIVCTTCIVEPVNNFITTDLTDTMSYNPYKRAEFYDRRTGATVTNATYTLLRSGCDGGPPRVYYGNQLYYAKWSDYDVTAGFLSSVELLSWIGITQFTGTIYCNGMAKYECRDGHLFYADSTDDPDDAGSPEYERLKDVLAYDGCTIARETLAKL